MGRAPARPLWSQRRHRHPRARDLDLPSRSAKRPTAPRHPRLYTTGEEVIMDAKAIEVMNGQLQLDIDAASAYEEAISACSVEEIVLALTDFKGDHERHVSELKERIRSYGGEPKERKNVKGFFIKGFTKIVSRGDRSALLAMRGNEELTNRSYEAALKNDLPDDVCALLLRNLSDEQRHLQWMRDAIDTRAWDRSAGRGQAHAP
jgi:uncharacterized protein (TIGR02284 family)